MLSDISACLPIVTLLKILMGDPYLQLGIWYVID
jgi:hypothetical protein